MEISKQMLTNCYLCTNCQDILIDIQRIYENNVVGRCRRCDKIGEFETIDDAIEKLKLLKHTKQEK